MAAAEESDNGSSDSDNLSLIESAVSEGFDTCLVKDPRSRLWSILLALAKRFGVGRLMGILRFK